MIKVYQNFCDNECLKACLCSIFHLKFEDVPDFFKPNILEDFAKYVEKNLNKITVVTNPNIYIPNQYYIKTIGNQLFYHAYVAFNDKIVHCPTGYPNTKLMFSEPITFEELRYNYYKNHKVMLKEMQNFVFLNKEIFHEKPI